MTTLQKILIVVGTAAGFQLAQVLAGLSAGDLVEPRRLAVSAIVSIANAVGVALIALKTAGGLSLRGEV